MKRTQMSREQYRRRWGKRNDIAFVQKSPTECEVYYRHWKAGLVLDAVVSKMNDGSFTCNCTPKRDLGRCRHIVAVEIALGIYKNPYEEEYLRAKAQLQEVR